MEEERPEPQRSSKPSFGFFGFLLVIIAAIVFIVIGTTGGFNKAYSFKNTNEYIGCLLAGDVKTATLTPKYTMYVITGKYTTYKNGKGYDRDYVFRIDQTNFIECPEGGYEYNLYNDAREVIGTANTTSYELKNGTVAGNPSLSTILQDLSNRALNVKDGFKYNIPNDPFVANFWEEWGPTLIFMGGILIIGFLLISKLRFSVDSSNLKSMEFNKSRARRSAKVKTRFTDVAGAEEEKVEMSEIVEYLKDPKKFTKFGAKLPKGVLLVGHPGCGKTLLAKAVAGEADVPFYSVSGSDFVEMFVGVGAGRVRDMFKIAKENAPCLIFIDEIDAVGRQRGAGFGGGNDEREQTLNQLLVEMDGFNENTGIVVIAATNREDVLDPALLRAGRFDRKITVTLPDRKAREEIFKVHARGKTMAADVDFAHIAARTAGFSGADIENIMNEAAILAVRLKKNEVGVDEIDEAIDRRVAGPAKISHPLSDEEKKLSAYHEAGHAIIGIKYPHSARVEKITIIPRGNTGGHVRTGEQEDKFTSTKSELIARIVLSLGGRSSEEIFLNEISSGASNDIEQATAIARMMVTELGMSSLGPIQYERNTGSVFLGRDYTQVQKNFSSQTAEKIDNEIRNIIEFAHEEAKKTIEKYKDDVELLAQTLLKHEKITGDEIEYLLEHRHLKRDEVKEAKVVEDKPILENVTPIIENEEK